MSTLSRKDLGEFRPINGQPLLNIIEKCCCARHAFTYRRVGYEITRVVGEIALFAQSVEHDHPIHRQADGERQRLNRGLVVPRPAGQRAEAVGVEGKHGELHDGLIRSVEAIFLAQRVEPCVQQVALRGRKQARDGFPIRAIESRLIPNKFCKVMLVAHHVDLRLVHQIQSEPVLAFETGTPFVRRHHHGVDLTSQRGLRWM